MVSFIFLKDDEDFLVDNEEEMDVKEELEIKQDSTKEYLGKLQYKVYIMEDRKRNQVDKL